LSWIVQVTLYTKLGMAQAHTPDSPYASGVDQQRTADATPHLEGAIWFRSGQQHWGRTRHMALLAAINSLGSISAAAKHVGLSYKAAWDVVDAMNNLAGEVLVLRTTGGQRGGGARLTPRAHQLLQLYQGLAREHARFMTRLAAVNADQGRNLEWIEHMMTQVSIRNRLSGTVTSVHTQGVRADVTLKLTDTQSIVASITQNSAHTLGLRPGTRALALIKASSVIIAPPAACTASSVRNRLTGRISRISGDADDVEVNLALTGGYTMTASLQRATFDRLGLCEGEAASAVFAASQVMVGILD